MNPSVPRITIEQVVSFTTLAELGSFRAASERLCVSEQGLRGRVLALEDRLGTSLYEKERGRRGEVRLTAAGRTFLDRANRFMEEAQALTNEFDPVEAGHPVRIAVSHCTACLLTADVLRGVHAGCGDRPLQVVMRTEARVVSSVREDTSFSAGISTLDEPADGLVHRHWTSMDWRLVAPLGHPLLQQPSASLRDLVDEALIVFETNSAPRTHVMEAFHLRGLVPRIAMEVTSTPAAIRMVDAGLGLAIVPAPAWGVVENGARTGQTTLSDSIRAIEIAILTRPATEDDAPVSTVVDALLEYAAAVPADRDSGARRVLPLDTRRQKRRPTVAAA